MNGTEGRCSGEGRGKDQQHEGDVELVYTFNAQHRVSPGAVLWTSGKIYFETTNLLSI